MALRAVRNVRGGAFSHFRLHSSLKQESRVNSSTILENASQTLYLGRPFSISEKQLFCQLAAASCETEKSENNFFWARNLLGTVSALAAGAGACFVLPTGGGGNLQQDSTGVFLHHGFATMLMSGGRSFLEAPISSCQGAHAPASNAPGEDQSVGGGGGKSRLPPGFLETLLQTLPPERVVQDPEERRLHAKPWNSYHPMIDTPDAVVFPWSTEEVVAIVKACNRFGVPVTAYAGGTSIEGQTTTPKGGITINMTGMGKVLSVNTMDMDAVVQPGIGWMDLNEILSPHGLFFPLDPGPGATIGGMCSTRCSGSLAVRYGTMRDNVISLKAVLPNGEVISTGNRARKSSAGYDLTQLFIGAEGTLGIITEVTLRLQNIPESSAVAIVGGFLSVKDAADAAIATMQSGIQVSRVELLDEVMVSAINSANGFSYEETPTLMFELIGSPAHVKEQLTRVSLLVSGCGGSTFTFADSPDEKEELWRARKEALWAAASVMPDAEALITDVCVPLSRLAECIQLTKEDLASSPLFAPLVAHAGDGNFHVCIFFDTKKESEVEEAKRLSDRMVHRALAMDGTCTGEHGVGTGKIKYLEKELGPHAVSTMASIKHAIDPSGIMNPGKVVPINTSGLCH